MRFTKSLIPLSVILALGAGVACNKPAPAPVEVKPVVAPAPTPAEVENTKKAAEEEAVHRKAEAEAEAEAARKAAAAAETEKAEKVAAFKSATTAALKDINFDFDKSEIREVDKGKLQAIADYLKSFPAATVQIEGNCDERGTVEYNLGLGERRAHAAQDYLVTLGVSADRLSTISYGKEKPKVEGHDNESWLINRRDEFKLK